MLLWENDTSHTSANSEETSTPSQPAHTLLIQEQDTHVIESSFHLANRTLRTWKKLARDNIMDTETTQGPTTVKRNREEDLEFLLELPTKKLQVSTEKCQQNKMVEAAQQPHQA